MYCLVFSQQYLGTAMLLVALFLVLLSNHMDERLKEGKSVIRLDTCCKAHYRGGKISSERDAEVGGVQVYDEHTPLIKSGHTVSKVTCRKLNCISLSCDYTSCWMFIINTRYNWQCMVSLAIFLCPFFLDILCAPTLSIVSRDLTIHSRTRSHAVINNTSIIIFILVYTVYT